MKVFFFAMLYFTILEIRDATIEFTSQRLARGPHRNSKLYEKLKRQNGVLILASSSRWQHKFRGSREHWTASQPRISATNPVSNSVKKDYRGLVIFPMSGKDTFETSDFADRRFSF